MAIKNINVNNHICLTCDYYICNRKPTGAGFVSAEGGTGRCYLVDNYNGMPREWGSTCSGWVPWGPIKKFSTSK